MDEVTYLLTYWYLHNYNDVLHTASGQGFPISETTMHIDFSGPLCLDFGRVVVRSTVERHVSVRNFLTKHISIAMKVHTSSVTISCIFYFTIYHRGITNYYKCKTEGLPLYVNVFIH